MEWTNQISSDPTVCHGKACVKGTRIMVSVVLANIAAGLNNDQIRESYPRLTDEDILACLSYASELAREEDILPLRSFAR
jgi:uncharacterized protein (DUF433 family)